MQREPLENVLAAQQPDERALFAGGSN